MRRGWLAGVATMALFAAPAAEAAKVRIVSSSVAQVSDTGVKVKLRGSHGRLRLVALRGGQTLTDPREVKRGVKRVRLPLTTAGRAALATCAAGRVRVLGFKVTSNRVSPRLIAGGRRHLTGGCPTAEPPKPEHLTLPGEKACDPLDPAVCLQPYPSDFFTVADPATDTGRRLHLPQQGMPANTLGVRSDPAQWNRNDGFSPGSAIVTKVPGLDSEDALAKTGAVPIDDIARSFDANQPVVIIDAATLKRWPVWTEIDVNADDPADRNVIVRPAKNFLEGHRYVVALRTMKNASGETIEPGPAFKALRDGTVTDSAALEARRPHTEGLMTTLAKAGVGRDDLFLAWDFTVASERSLTERMLKIRNDAFAQLGDTDLSDLQVQGSAPAYTVDKVTDFADGPIMRQVEGKVTVPCYLDTPGCTTGGVFHYNGQLPAQLPGNTMQARITCNIPRIAEQGGLLRPGIYGHGLLGSRGEVNQSQLKTLSNTYGFVFCATDWSGMACTDLPDVPPTPEDIQNALEGRTPDCDIPTVATILLKISNFPKLADRVQQGMLNQLFVGRAMIHPDGLSTNPAFQINGKSVIDTQRLYYDGNSQGGIIGGALIAVAPDLDRGVIGVPGMNYSTLLRRSVDFDTYAQVLYNAYPDELERPLLLQILQLQWDRAEADGYAQHMTDDPLPGTPAHTVLMHAGLGDHQVSNYAAKVEARTIGAHALAPWAAPGRDTDKQPLFGLPPITGGSYDGSAIVLFDSGSPVPPKAELPPRDGEDPHEFPRRSKLGMKQKDAFLRPDGKVIDVCGDQPCTTTPEG